MTNYFDKRNNGKYWREKNIFTFDFNSLEIIKTPHKGDRELSKDC